jgi:nucleoid DNA-binding protein
MSSDVWFRPASGAILHQKLIAVLAKECGVTKVLAKRLLRGLVQTIQERPNVGIPGLGVFRIVKTKSRKIRDLATGEIITLPPSRTVKFRAAKALRQKLTQQKGKDEL